MNSIEQVFEIFKGFHQIEVDYGKLQWTLFTTGYDFGVENKYAEMVDFLKDEKKFSLILKCREEELAPVDQRRVEIVYNTFRPYHLSPELNELDRDIERKVNELAAILNSFRYTLGGKRVTSVELDQILSTESERGKREEAYLAKNQINKPLIEGGFIELLNLRKRYAQVYGAEDYVAYKLEMNELDRDIFDHWTEQLHELLPGINELRGRYAREYLQIAELMPWDEQYLASQLAPSLTSRVEMTDYYQKIRNLFLHFEIDIDEFNITYDIFPRANKSEWGYNFPIETARDSRILANVKDKYYEFGVLLHETGHGVHSFLLDPEKLILNEGVSGIVAEGIANLFQQFLYSPLFYDKFFENGAGVETEFSRLREYRKISSLRSINRIFFDHSLYRNELESLDDIYDLYWKNRAEVLKEKPFTAAPPWAYLIHHTTHPVYLHNYFMGDVTCEMLFRVFKERFEREAAEKPKEFGRYILDEVINPSGLYRYHELFKRISGEDFTIKYLQ